MQIQLRRLLVGGRCICTQHWHLRLSVEHGPGMSWSRKLMSMNIDVSWCFNACFIVFVGNILKYVILIWRSLWKGFAADRGSLEMDSRALGDFVLPLIVWYMFSIIYFFIYLIYQGRWPWYIIMKMIPKERSSWVSVPWMFQYIVNSYPPFGNHAKMGIDN